MAGLKDKDIEARGLGKTVSDEEILALLQKMVKSRQESLAIYSQGRTTDLADQESEEIAIISEFLPKALGEDEVKAAIEAAIAETGAASVKDMGKVIGLIKTQISRPDRRRQGERPGQGDTRQLRLRFGRPGL